MAIINRLARLFKADFHAVLDHIEEPELQLKQAIREMDEQLQANQADTRRLQSRVSELHTRQSAAEELLLKTDKEIAVCFENENEDLARGLIRRKLETKSIIHSFSAEVERMTQQITAMQKEAEEFASLLSSMQQKATLMNSHSHRRAPLGYQDESPLQINDSDVEIALLQEKQRFETQAT